MRSICTTYHTVMFSACVRRAEASAEARPEDEVDTLLSRVLGCKMVGSCKTRFLRDRKTLSLDLSLVQYNIYLKLKYLRKKGEDQMLLPCDFKNIVQYCAKSEKNG